MHKKQGFTLVELLTVVLIIGILTAVGLPQYKKVVEKARISEAQAMLRTIYDSSERLAGEFGYRDYAQLIDNKGTAGYSFPRMDMFDASNLPAGCSLNIPGTELTCARFSYKPVVANRYVAAKKLGNPYAGTLLLFDRTDSNIYCQGVVTACDLYGLDTRTGVTY